jgi:two-component system NtrC family response regulator
LDEIAELDLSLQVKLLRFLQEQTIERVGGRDPIRVDARILAATHQDPEKEVAAGRLREDLFYRINVVRIVLPPLRERGSDVLLLAHRFLEQFSIQAKKRIKGFSASANDALVRYAWPGNVRELENRIRRAVIMSDGEFLCAADLDLEEPSQTEEKLSLREAREQIDREMVVRALAENRRNIKEAAAQLGISRQSLYDLLAKHSIQL